MTVGYVTANSAGTSGRNDPSRPIWTFSSSGWLFLYHFGVIKCLKDLNLHRDIYAIGTSGGSCAGAFLRMDRNLDDVARFVLSCAVEARSSMAGLFRLKKYVSSAILEFSPEDLPDYLRGNYEVSVTTLPWMKNKRITDWKNLDEIEASVLASSCAVPFAGFPVKVPGLGYCVDGGFSDFQLLKALLLGKSYFAQQDHASVTVCPFYCSRAHIKPSEYVPIWWAFLPPAPEELWKVYELGQRDAKAWVIQNHGHNYLQQQLSPKAGPDQKTRLQEALNSFESMGGEISGTMQDALHHLESMGEDVSGAVTEALHRFEAVGGEISETMKEALNRFESVGGEISETMQDAMRQAEIVGEEISETMYETMSVMCMLLMHLLDSVGWTLVYMELAIHAFISAIAAILAPFLPRSLKAGGSTAKAWHRCASFSYQIVRPQLWLKTIPSIGSHIRMNRETIETIFHLSFFFRILWYLKHNA